MRIANISILSIFACFSAFADARLPVVNMGAGSVSARAAFGEKVEVSPRVTEKKSVSARAASVDVGEKITKAKTDVLTPKKPSSDLWAKMEKPLRLPEPQEFTIIKDEYNLPEEDLGRKTVARAADLDAVSAQVSALDSQIARLVELQRKADETSRANARVAAAPKIVKKSEPVQRPSVVARAPVVPVYEDVVTPAPVQIAEEKIAVNRVVVPIYDDVVVRPVQQETIARAAKDSDMSKLSPTELKKAFKKTYLSENKHLSTYQIDDRFDVASDVSSSVEGFSAVRDLSESGGVRPLEIKIGFRGDDAALSRDNYNLLTEYASIVVANPKRAIQVSIPEKATRSLDDRKLAARRLAIVEQVLRDTGVSDQRVMPVLAQRNDDSFVLRVISADQFETMTQQKRDMFGDSVGKKTYKSMSW